MDSVGVPSFPFPLYPTTDLKERPVRSQGQTGDLRHTEEVNGVPVRYWTERVGLADGAPWENTVAVEALVDDSWKLVAEYDGKTLRGARVQNGTALQALRG